MKYLKKYNNLLGGSNTNDITIIEEDNTETEFAQKSAYINFGIGELSTYNLVNCIAVGGIFDCSGKQGSFLTHEAPTDYGDLFYKLKQIQIILEENNCIINNIVLFRIDETGADIYDNSLTVEDIIEIVRKHLIVEFKIEPEIKIYSCKDFMCGKAIISPDNISTTLQFIKMTEETEEKKEERNIEGTFTPIVLENKYGDKVYQCPYKECLFITGTGAVEYPQELKYWSHCFDCINKNKLPI
jgi:hypothetical protein